MFQTKRYQQIFAQHHLDGFEPIWNKKIDWFEAPNYRRGGWSGVGKLDLDHGEDNQGQSNQKQDDFLSVFVKKQMNHGRQTLLHPFAGEPTFRREFVRLQYLQQQEIGAPRVVFYDEKIIDQGGCAILITKTLQGYEPFDVVTQQLFERDDVTRKQKRTVLKEIAQASRHFHKSHLVHRAFYPKHIFVKNATTKPEVAFIDLEKSRFKMFFIQAAYFDLAALLRHADYWSRSDRLYFFLHYFQRPRLTRWTKILCRFIMKRAAR